MSDGWKTLRVPVENYDAAKAQKEEHGRTWGEQIVRPDDDTDDSLDPDAIADAVVDALDMDDPEDRCGPDFDALAREVEKRIDYAMLASKVAEEVMEEMQR